MSTFAERYNATLAELAQVCQSCGRKPEDVCVVAVSKTVGIPEVQEAVAAGAHNFGENRPDLLMEKSLALPNETWHMIGNIQSRRIADIVAHASLVHSLYQPHHVAKFETAAAAAGKVQDVLLEVNVSGEESKSGLEPHEVEDMLSLCLEQPHLRVCGLMTMAPAGDLAVARECFEGLAALHEQLKASLQGAEQAAFNELSMGMSQDWREAVAAGATIVRIGRALFSDNFNQ